MYITEEQLIRMGMDHEQWTVEVRNKKGDRTVKLGRAFIHLDLIDFKEILHIQKEPVLHYLTVTVKDSYFEK